MSSKRHFYLGLFFLAAFAILAFYTFFLTDFTLFGDKVTRTIQFHSAGGLRTGNTVQVAGMHWGKVSQMSFDPSAEHEKRVTVVVALDSALILYDDYEILIKDATVLGGKLLAIEPGTPSLTTIEQDKVLAGGVLGNVLDSLGEVVDENRDALQSAIAGIDLLVGEARTGEGLVARLINNKEMADAVETAVTSIGSTFDNALIITQDLRDGQGTLGKLLSEDVIYNRLVKLGDDLDLLFEDTRGIIGDARTGEGLLARILNDKQLSQDAADLLADAREIAGGLRRGEGTLGQLLQDQTLSDNLKELSRRLVDGEGTLGKLFSEQALYDDIAKIASDFTAVSDALAKGEGTLGKLIMSEELYNELEQAIGTMTGALEEAREAAPVTTLLNTIFLGF